MLPALLAIAALWALVAFAAMSLRTARGLAGERARPVSSGPRGLAFAFTGAMTPAHKESVRLHPLAFLAGLALHAGVALSLATTAAVTLAPATVAGAAPGIRIGVAAALGAALAAAVGLAVHRAVSRELRSVSLPDDFVASALIALLVAAALGTAVWPGLVPALQSIAIAVLVYAPFGKLRHAVYFFLARGHLGWRLGQRGTYPPVAGGAHGRR